MDYLKVSRQASEGRRAARLSRGHSCFIEGSSSFVECVHRARSTSAMSVSTVPRSDDNIHLDASLPDAHPTRPRIHVRSLSSISEGKNETSASSDSNTAAPESTSGHGKRFSSDESHWLFRRAANLLRESLELDGDGGVAILDASSGSSDCQSTDGSDSAPVLAVSTNHDHFAPKPGSTMSYPVAIMDRKFLQQMLRQHSKGKLWSFHRDGSVSTSDDDEDALQESYTYYQALRHLDGPKSGGRKWKAVENILLNHYFPNASQLLFVPLWNAASSQWFGGCFCWNTVETHVFANSVELSSVSGFGSSIMGEWSRIQSLIADQQKADFIGSIS